MLTAQNRFDRSSGTTESRCMVGLDEKKSAKVFVSTLAALPGHSALSEMLTGSSF